ncbi:MAG: glycosyltransferase family A protein [Paracoccaceae bacterium]
MTKLTITYVVPCFNAGNYLSEMLESLIGQLGPMDQILLIDDGSTDGSVASAEALGLPGLKVLTQANQGPSVARNAGIEEAKTDLIAFFDSDDLAPVGRTSALIKPFLSDPSLEATFGSWENFWEEEVSEEEEAASDSLKGTKNTFAITAGIFKRSCFNKYGMFQLGHGDPSEILNPHITWLLNADKKGLTSARIDDLVLNRRIHRNNLSRKKTTDRLFDIARQVLETRRAKKK